MGVYIGRKLLALPLVLLGVSFLVFAVIRALPGDPARIMAGPQATQDAVDGMRHRLGLDRPFFVQYASFLVQAAHGDLGTSIQSKRPVLDEITQRFPNTLALASTAYATAIVIGLAVGGAAAIGR